MPGTFEMCAFVRPGLLLTVEHTRVDQKDGVVHGRLSYVTFELASPPCREVDLSASET